MAEFYKAERAYFQTPACSLPNLNGIKLPESIQNPIPASEIDTSCLIGWDKAMGDITQAITGSRKTIGASCVGNRQAVIVLDEEDVIMN